MEHQEKKPEVWQRQEAETAKAFYAFTAFRDAGPTRTVEAVYRQTGGKQGGNRRDKVPSHWREWAARYEWVSRARAYDAHLELLARTGREEVHTAQIAAFRERAHRTAMQTGDMTLALLLKAGQRLQTLDPAQIEPHALPAYLRAAAAVMEASLNAEAEAIGVRALEFLLDKTPPDSNRAEGG